MNRIVWLFWQDQLMRYIESLEDLYSVCKLVQLNEPTDTIVINRDMCIEVESIS